MIWRRLANLIRTIRTELMVELEAHPQALRQGAAAAVAVAAVAAAMPAISHRAAEQRADAEWAARAEAFQQALASNSVTSEAGPSARVTLASYPAADGFRASVQGAPLARDFDQRHAATIAVALRDQAALVGLGAFQPATLRTASDQAKEAHCLAQAIYYEARGESFTGQVAVAEVVVNRARSRHYPDKFCDVVYEGSWRSTGCQFTFTCDGSLRNKPRGEPWRRANLIAAQVMMGVARPITHDATHYHTTEVAPVWSASLVETTRIGSHIFYRFPNRRERAAMRAAPDVEATPQAVDAAIAAAAPGQVSDSVASAAIEPAVAAETAATT